MLNTSIWHISHIFVYVVKKFLWCGKSIQKTNGKKWKKNNNRKTMSTIESGKTLLYYYFIDRQPYSRKNSLNAAGVDVLMQIPLLDESEDYYTRFWVKKKKNTNHSSQDYLCKSYMVLIKEKTYFSITEILQKNCILYIITTRKRAIYFWNVWA